jgi:hypothetical protein
VIGTAACALRAEGEGGGVKNMCWGVGGILRAVLASRVRYRGCGGGLKALGLARAGWSQGRGVGGCWGPGNALGPLEWALVVPRGSGAVGRRVFMMVFTTARFERRNDEILGI